MNFLFSTMTNSCVRVVNDHFDSELASNSTSPSFTFWTGAIGAFVSSLSEAVWAIVGWIAAPEMKKSARIELQRIFSCLKTNIPAVYAGMIKIWNVCQSQFTCESTFQLMLTGCDNLWALWSTCFAFTLVLLRLLKLYLLLMISNQCINFALFLKHFIHVVTW